MNETPAWSVANPVRTLMTGRQRLGKIAAVVAAFAPLLVAGAMAALWARSVWIPDRFECARKATAFDRAVGRVSFYGDEVWIESGQGVAGLKWHQFLILGREHEELGPGGMNAVNRFLSSGTTLERQVVDERDPLFGRRPGDVGPWKVFHWEGRRKVSSTGTLMGGPETHTYRVFAAPYWLLMAPCFLPLAWWAACPPGRALPRLTLRRLAALVVLMALGCWALAAFARSSVRDRALSMVSELGGSFIPGERDLYFGYDDDSGGIDDAGAVRLRAALAVLPRLRTMTSFSKSLSGTRFAFLADQPDLEDVNFYGIQEENVAMSYLRDAPMLKHLSLRGDGLTDESLADLKGLVSLESLNLRGQPISDAGLAHLMGLPKLYMVLLDSKQPKPGAILNSKVTVEGVRRLFKATPNLGQVDLPDGRRMGRGD